MTYLGAQVVYHARFNTSGRYISLLKKKELLIIFSYFTYGHKRI